MDKVLIEDKSRDTVENAIFSKAVLVEKGFNKPILVTSAFHMRRSIMAFRKVGLEVIPVPSSFRTAPGAALVWADWLPSANSLDMTATVLHEYLGLIYYTFFSRGTV